MEGAEKEYEEFLRNEITRWSNIRNTVMIVLSVAFWYRLERLEHLAARFNHKASNLEGWMAGKHDSLSQQEDLQSASQAEAMVRPCISRNSIIIPCVIYIGFAEDT